MKRFVCFLILFLLAGCAARQEPLESISEVIGLDVTGGEILEAGDSHGGFLGDGETVVAVSVPGLELPEDPRWHPLPLSRNLCAAVYGWHTDTASFGPLFPADSVPAVEHGSWFFMDRHSESTDPADDTDLHSRSSWNFTAAIYDADTGVLYYLELDT